MFFAVVVVGNITYDSDDNCYYCCYPVVVIIVSHDKFSLVPVYLVAVMIAAVVFVAWQDLLGYAQHLQTAE